MKQIEERQFRICSLLLAVPTRSSSGTEPGPETNPDTSPPVSNCLTEFLRHLLRKNRGAGRNLPPPGLSDPSVMATVFTQLLRLLRPYFEGRAACGPPAFPAGQLVAQVRAVDPALQCCYGGSDVALVLGSIWCLAWFCGI